MKAVEVHNLEDPQLVEFADNARKELFNLRFQHATGQLENTARLRAGEEGPGARADGGAPAWNRRGSGDPQTDDGMAENEEEQ